MNDRIEDEPYRRLPTQTLGSVAGGAAGHRTAIVTGVASLHWGAVPPGIFDVAEGTVDWRIEPGDTAVSAVVRTQVSGPGSPAGIAVRIMSGTVSVPVPEPQEVRTRVRTLASSRLARLGDDAFLAEVLAAEADY